MRPILKNLLYIVFSGILIVLASGWLVLASPVFSGLRRSIVAEALSKQIGQEVVIEGDVRLFLGRTSQLKATGVRLPSSDPANPFLAELENLSTEIDTLALLRREIDFDNLLVSGLHVLVRLNQTGQSNWPKQALPDTPSRADADPYLLGFLRQKNFGFDDILLRFENRRSGFEFEFLLSTLTHVAGKDDQPAELSGHGTVNQKPLQISGTFPRTGRFETQTTFGNTILKYSGRPHRDGAEFGHAADLEVRLGSLVDLLEGLKLNAPIGGTASIKARVVREAGLLQISDLSVNTEFEDGSGFAIAGDVANLRTVHGLDLRTSVWLFPKDARPPPANSLQEFELTGLQAHVLSDFGKVFVKDVVIQSNALETKLGVIGPASVGRVRRTEDGRLSLTDIHLLAGPDDTPFLDATGEIHDALNLRDVSAKGVLQANASLVFQRTPIDPRQFGGARAQFEVTDALGYLALSSLDLSSQNTDLWTLDGHARLGNIAKLSDIDVSVAIGFPDSRAFFHALDLAPVDGGAFSLSLAVNGDGADFLTAMGLTMGQSRLDTSWATRIENGAPNITGQMTSDHVNIEDVANLVEAIMRLSQLEISEKKGDESFGEKELKPLVLPEEKAEPELKPLVLADAQPGLSDLVDIDRILTGSNVNIGIDISRIRGQEGVSKIDSDLTIQQGKASLGPIDFTYGRGQVSVSAAIDLAATPELLTVSGATRGWDFGEILDAVGAGIAAYGSLGGQFELTGIHASPSSFLRTARGWAHISLANGKIGTSLIDLAGLGVLPWIFSKSQQQGFSRIVCMEAPIRIDGGRVSFDSVVLETETVQLVAAGEVDPFSNRIELKAEPRPVGKPLARAAWPFRVTGSLTSPEIILSDATERRREDGGETEIHAKRIPCKPDIRQLR